MRTHVVLDGGLVVAGAERVHEVGPPEPPVPPPGGARPALPARSRTFLDDDGAVCVCVPLDPVVRRGRGGVTVARATREVRVQGANALVWALLRHLDGEADVDHVLGCLPDPAAGADLLAALVAAGAVDVGPRPIGRLVHGVTKRGAVGGGGLDPTGIVDLVTDGGYRRYPAAARTPLPATVPPELGGFDALTRRRRSPSEFGPGSIPLATVAALLTTACGVTGSAEIDEGRDLPLRAYPSPGALYAVEVYPVALDVEGLDAGVYHYVASDESLEHARPGVGRDDLLAAALPGQRASVQTAAVAICLTGVFARFERKYGEGGYRILAAEAGHLAQNLVLAATALGLGARPVGGFFDDLLNQALGLDVAEEQFLLCVLVGRPPAPSEAPGVSAR